MKKYLDLINKQLPLLSIVFYCLISVVIIYNNGLLLREDEAHAWTIAQNTNLVQLIDLMKVEGHFLLWYLVIMPFAKLNLFYPYSMSAINFGFMLGAIILLWKKAPFNNYIKLFITFSEPVISVFSVQARCYGIGIFFLFLSMANYENRMKHPYRYVILLALAANTSLSALIPAFILGLLFLYDLAKVYIKRLREIELKNKNAESKKAFELGDLNRIWWFIVCIIVFNAILFYFQFFGFQLPGYEKTTLIKAPYLVAAYLGLKHNMTVSILLKMILLWIGTVIFPVSFYRDKQAFIFFIFSELITLMFFTFVYEARIHHICMMFIFAIMSYWIYKINVKENSKSFLATLAISILAFCMIFVAVEKEQTKYRPIINNILQDQTLMQAKLFTNVYPISFAPLLPLVRVYGLDGVDLASYEALKGYFTKRLRVIQTDKFMQEMSTEKDNYIILNGYFTEKSVNEEKYKFDVSLYKTIPFENFEGGVYIYKVSKSGNFN